MEFSAWSGLGIDQLSGFRDERITAQLGSKKYLCDPALYFDNVQWYLAVLGPSEERTDLLIHGFIPKVIPVKPMATDHLPAVCPGAGANHQPGEFPRSLVGHCDDVCSGAPGLTWEAHWVYMKYMHAET